VETSETNSVRLNKGRRAACQLIPSNLSSTRMSSAWPSCGREKHHAVELAAESAATLEEFRVFCRLVIYEERGEPRGRVLQVVCFVEDEQGRAEARASASLHTSSITAARERRACSNLSSEAFDRTGSLRSSSTTGNSTSASISSSASCR